MEGKNNQWFGNEKEAQENQDELFERNCNRIQHEITEMGYKVINPIGQNYDERYNSVEANLMHANAKKITKVLKPVIYHNGGDGFVLVQKGVVIVE